MHHKFVIYPFAALVGQEMMKKALLINAVDPSVGGVLIKGDKGTGKSTAVRALADLLGEIDVVAGCPFNCHPLDKRLMCKACQDEYEKEGSLPQTRKKMEIVDMPLSATEDMVIGSIDIKKALQGGSKALEPGLLARSNRNVLYIDEVNLLDDYLVNILLDAAAMGVNVVEREGITLYHPARFILIGTMNPEEGELRPQIIDRFGLSVEVKALTLPEERLQVMDNRREFDTDPYQFEQRFYEVQDSIKEAVSRAGRLLEKIELSRKKLVQIVKLSASLGIKTHRADIVMDKTSRVIAALDGRDEVSDNDIKEAAILVLAHRLRQDPLEKTAELTREQIDHILQDEPPPELPEPPEQEQDGEREESEPPERQGSLNSELLKFSDAVGSRGKDFSGSEGKRGQFVRARPNPEPGSLAVNDTLRRAAERSGSLNVLLEHLMEKVRIARGKAVYFLLLDTSSSMRLERKIRLAKTLSWQLLQKSYRQRNRVALVTFREDKVKEAVPLTSDVSKIDELLQTLPTGGKTPLTPALFKVLSLAGREKEAYPVALIISDGKANVFRGESLEADLKELKGLIAKSRVKLIFVNTESRKRSLGMLENMAEDFGSEHFYLEDLL